MGIYVEAQTAINQRRMEEVAAQQQAEVQSIAPVTSAASDVDVPQMSDTTAAVA